MATAFQEAEARGYYAQLKRDYTARRDAMRAMLEGAGLPTLTAGGTFFLLADVTGFGKPDDVSGLLPPDRDGGGRRHPALGLLRGSEPRRDANRFCFAKRPENLAAAAERFATLRAM